MGNALRVMRVCGSGICRAGCPGTHAEVVQIKAVAAVPALVVSKSNVLLLIFLVHSKMRRLQRNLSVFQQTKILLWKNVLIKWRMKMQSFQVVLFHLIIIMIIIIISDH